MRECKICHCEIKAIIRKHEKSNAHEEFLEKAIIIEYAEKGINVDRLKDILIKRFNDHMEKITDFTIMYCWKVNNIEYSITIVNEEVSDSKSNQESLDSNIKRVFNQINIDIFEEFTLTFVSDIKKITYRYYMNQPMEMIKRKMMRSFIEGKDANYRYRYQLLPDCILHPKLDYISRFRAPCSFRSDYLELPNS